RGISPFFGAYLNTVLWQVNGLSSYIQSTTPLSNFFGKWTHFLVTYDKNASSNNFRIYINGKLDKQATATGTPTTAAADILMGKYSNLYTTGQIDDVRIYNYALTPAQVKTLYNGGAVSFN
ncbi:MAG: LamG-like jellyroll fold domain-containing protein, partial [Candidatus Shapirobacteria bacterium]